MFPVSIISGEPVWFSLPCVKISDYPLEKRDYKPFAQARMCISDKTLYLQMLSFEVAPEVESRVMADISFDGGMTVLHFSCNREGDLSCKAGENDITKHVAIRVYTGEDEQGIYWAVNFTVSVESLWASNIKFSIKPGETILANFYKISTGSKKHFGSWAHTDFKDDGTYDEINFSEMEMTDY